MVTEGVQGILLAQLNILFNLLFHLIIWHGIANYLHGIVVIAHLKV